LAWSATLGFTTELAFVPVRQFSHWQNRNKARSSGLLVSVARND
jgi:hypothetical protein